MEIILLERVENLGQMGDTVTVKPGFARNFLLPQNKAVRASKQNIAWFENRKAQLEADNLKKRQEAEAVGAKVEGMKLTVVRQASEMGVLYGSVTTRDLAELAKAAGATIDRRQIVLDKPIKTLGLFPIRVRLHPEVAVEITANVARSEEEAEMQLEKGAAVISTLEEEENDSFFADARAENAAEDAEAAAEAEVVAKAEEIAEEAEEINADLLEPTEDGEETEEK